MISEIKRNSESGSVGRPLLTGNHEPQWISTAITLSGEGYRSRFLSVVIVWSSDVQHISAKGQYSQREHSFVRGRNSVMGRNFATVHSSVRGRNRKPVRLLLQTRIRHQALPSGPCISEAVQVVLALAVDTLGHAQKQEHLQQQGESSEERRLQAMADHWSIVAEQKHCCSWDVAQAGVARRVRAAFCTCSTT